MLDVGLSKCEDVLVDALAATRSDADIVRDGMLLGALLDILLEAKCAAKSRVQLMSKCQYSPCRFPILWCAEIYGKSKPAAMGLVRNLRRRRDGGR